MSCNCKTIVQNFHGGEVGPISGCTGPISTYQINGCGNNQVSFFGRYTMPPSAGTASQVLQFPVTGGSQLVWASDDRLTGGTLTDNCTASTQTLVLNLNDGNTITITGNSCTDFCDNAMSGITAHYVTGCTSTLTLGAPLGTVLSGQTSACTDTFYVTTVSGCPVTQTVTVNEATFTHQNFGINTRNVDHRLVINASGNGSIFDGSGYNDKRPGQLIHNLTRFSGSDATIAVQIASSGSSVTGKRSMVFGLDSSISGDSPSNSYFGIASGATDVSTGQWLNVNTTTGVVGVHTHGAQSANKKYMHPYNEVPLLQVSAHTTYPHYSPIPVGHLSVCSSGSSIFTSLIQSCCPASGTTDRGNFISLGDNNMNNVGDPINADSYDCNGVVINGQASFSRASGITFFDEYRFPQHIGSVNDSLVVSAGTNQLAWASNLFTYVTGGTLSATCNAALDEPYLEHLTVTLERKDSEIWPNVVITGYTCDPYSACGRTFSAGTITACTDGGVLTLGPNVLIETDSGGNGGQLTACTIFANTISACTDNYTTINDYFQVGAKNRPLVIKTTGSTIQPGIRHAVNLGQGAVIQGKGPLYTTIAGGVAIEVLSGKNDSGIIVQPEVNFIGGGSNQYLEGSTAGAILGGMQNEMKLSNYATIGGGALNIVSGSSLAGIFSGQFNRISGSTHSTLAGGFNNQIKESNYSLIGGGRGNMMTASTESAIIAGSVSEIFDSVNATIGGGNQNKISGATEGFIGGGGQNVILDPTSSAIVGGQKNMITGPLSDYSFIGAGTAGIIENSNNSVIVVGDGNRVLDSKGGSIVGGFAGTIQSSPFSFIGTGEFNAAGTSNYGFVGTGRRNTITASSNNSAVVGGEFNVISASTNSGIVAGGATGVAPNLINNSSYSFMGAPNLVEIRDSQHVFVGSAVSSKILSSSQYSMIINGIQNNVSASTAASILNGGFNLIESSQYGFIGSGQQHKIETGNTYTTILNGSGGTVTYDSSASTILNGYKNIISGSPESFIGNGDFNRIRSNGRKANAILLGDTNTIDVANNYNTILNGVSNLLSGTGISFIGTAQQSHIISNDYSFIGSGTKNKIHPNYNAVHSSDFNIIGGGDTNLISGSGVSVIVGGTGQIIQSADWASILGGRFNKIDIGASYGVIVGGLQNSILPDGGFGLNLYDFIGGGQKNVITGSNSSVIVGGIGNLEDASTGTFIGGGASNTISATSNYSTIVGGGWNIIGLGYKSNYSFIGGGQYNYISGSGFSNLVGGYTNRVWESDSSSLVGGENNILSGGSHNFLGGGISNKLTGGNTVVPKRNVLVGGNINTLSNSEDSVLVGGNQSTIDSSNNAVIVGGGRQRVQADSHNSGILVGGTNIIWDSSINSAIVAGKNLGISGTSSYSMIGAGQHNYLSTTVNSGVFVGFTNRILNSTNSSITSGQFNLINPSDNAFLGGGDTNAIQNSNIATLVGGRGNRITTSSTGSFVGGGKWNSISGESPFAVVVGGRNNEISGGTGSTIVGGFSNRIWTPNEVASDRNRYAFIGGGQSNIVVDGSDNAFIGGGSSNRISGATTAIIVGGNANGITASTNSFIGGGGQNVIYARETIDNYNFIGGGITNRITGNTFSFIGGGFGHRVINGDAGGVIWQYNTLVGGLHNSLSGSTGSFIGGGERNYISGTTNSSIVGGRLNKIETPYGGNFTSTGDRQESDFSVIGGGSINIIQKAAHSAVIGGGRQNLIQNSGNTSVIAGGSGNTISNDTFATVIGGGIDNIVGSLMNSGVISGGKLNKITATTINASTESTIGGGYQNLIWDSSSSVIAGGDENIISASTTGFIGGGEDNIISGASRHSGIGSGQRNILGEQSYYSFVGGGQDNYLWYYSNHSVIGGGFRNKLWIGSEYSLIGGGFWNIVSSSTHSSLVGGEYNVISGDSPTRSHRNFLGGGYKNYIVANRGSSIVGGEENYIYSGSNFSFIGGGVQNKIYQQRSVPSSLINTYYAFIGGGQLNVISGGTNNTIVGGDTNLIWGDDINGDINKESNYSFIGGGAENIIRHDTNFGTIGGGDQNVINFGATSVIGGGHSNFISGNSSTSILGGSDNQISDSSTYSNIGGGNANLIFKNSTSSAIGGGSNNSILNSSVASSIGGGNSNMVYNDSDYSNIDGGGNNKIYQTNFSNIGGGATNLIRGVTNNVSAVYATIGGGDSNIIQSDTGFMIGATIGGGRDNRISGGTLYTTILGMNTVGGGGDNSIGEYITSTIGGGYRNAMVISTAGRNESWNSNNTIGGGSGNTMTDGQLASTIGGGRDNLILNSLFPSTNGSGHNTIGGGRDNVVSGASHHVTIGGGNENYVRSAYRATIGGGDSNFIYSPNVAWGEYSYYGTIGGGRLNRIEKGSRETIGGGHGNRIIKGIPYANGNQTRSNVIAGGEDNAISSSTKYGAVVGGYGNYLNRAGASLIGGGRWNVISGWGSYHELGIEASAIVGGQGNLLFKTPLSIIGAGQRNQITGGSLNIIGGGIHNRMSGHMESVLVGGYANQMQTDLPHGLYRRNFLGGGQENLLSASTESIIVGGAENDIRKSEHTSILGGEANNIKWSKWSSIAGGKSNAMVPLYPGASDDLDISSYSHIGGGWFNKMSGGNMNFIGAGLGNMVFMEARSAIGSGQGNQLSGSVYTQSQISANFIGGGSNNIGRQTIQSFIGGGILNKISGGSHNVVVGGSYNELSGTSHSFVGGGSGNTMHQYYRPNTAGAQPYLSVENNAHSFIGAGSDNIISGASHSFIGAGSGNTINPASTTGSTQGQAYDFADGYGYSGTGAYIGAGFSNYISGSNRSTIVNGYGNIIKGEPLSPDLKYPDQIVSFFHGQPHVDNLIASGNHNRILDFGPQRKLLSYNQVRKATIINGRFNTISGSNMSLIGTGTENRIHGWGAPGNNAILHGSGNTINYGAYRSTILGGVENEIVRVKVGPGTFGNPVFAGAPSVVQGHGLIAQGYQNTISAVTYGTILNGESNTLTWGGDIAGVSVSESFAILNGTHNTIGSLGWFKPLAGDMRYSQIVGGNRNEVRGWSRNATIGGGERNSILGAGGVEFGSTSMLTPNKNFTGATGEWGAYNSMIGAGYYNTISGHTFIANSFIGAGAHNHIWSSPHSLIGAGYWNRILAPGAGENFTGASASTIVGGMRNYISGNTIASSIVGGEQNRIYQLGTHTIAADPSTQRSTKSHYSFIGGGFKNKISGSSWSSIVGGSGNTITGFTKTTGLPVDAAYSFIGGGSGSTIGAASGATILGGARNEILPFAVHSHILGGTGNTILGTATSSAILGCNDLTASIPNTTYMCALTASSISAQSFCLVNETGLVGCLSPNLWTGSTQLGNAAILSATTTPDPNGFARAGINTDQPASMLTFGNNVVGVGGNYNSITWSGGTIKLGLEAGWTEGITNKIPAAEHNNVWVGWQAGKANRTGGGNVGIGPQTLFSLLDGSGHTAIGISALKNMDATSNDGTSTIAIGNEAGLNVTSGGKQGSIIMGHKASQYLTSGSTIAIGRQSVGGVVGTGFDSQGAIGLGNYAVAGLQIGNSVATDEDEIMGLGNYSLYYLRGRRSYVNKNLAIGNRASMYLGFQNSAHGGKNVSGNLSVGHSSFLSAMEGQSNVLVGNNSGYWIKQGNYNVALGDSALGSATIGAGKSSHRDWVANVALGYSSMASAGTSQFTTAVGPFSAQHNLSGTANTFIGYQSGYGFTGGTYATVMGSYSALFYYPSHHDESTREIFIGHRVAQNAQGLSGTTAIGTTAAAYATGVTKSVIIGEQTAFIQHKTVDSVMVGPETAYSGFNNTRVVAIGKQALYSAHSNTGSISIGHQAGLYNTGDFDSVNIGTQAGALVTGQTYMTNIGPYAGGQAGLIIPGGGPAEVTTPLNYPGTDVQQMPNKTINIGYQTGLRSSGHHDINVGDQAGLYNRRRIGIVTTANVNVGFKSGYLRWGTGNTSMGNHAAFSGANSFNTVALGNYTLYSGASVESVVAIGNHAGFHYIGRHDGTVLDDGSVFIGDRAGLRLTGSSQSSDVLGNVAIGKEALANKLLGITPQIGEDWSENREPSGAVAIGSYAASNNVKGSYDFVAIGRVAAKGMYRSEFSVAIGGAVATNAYNSPRSIYMGYNAGADDYDGTETVAIGHSARGITDNSSGTNTQNTAIGAYSQQQTSKGVSESVHVGYNAGNTITNGDGIVGVGASAHKFLYAGGGIYSSLADYSVAVGHNAAYSGISMHSTIAVGKSAAYSGRNDYYSIMIGREAGYRGGTWQSETNSSRGYNIGLGYSAMKISSGSQMTIAIGAWAAGQAGSPWAGLDNTDVEQGNKDSDHSIYIGQETGKKSRAGEGQIAIGTHASLSAHSVSGDDNISIGTQAFYFGGLKDTGSNTTPSWATATGNMGRHISIGKQAHYKGQGITQDSIAIGTEALYSGGARYDIAMGYQAGYKLSPEKNIWPGMGNIAIGYQAMWGTTGKTYSTSPGEEYPSIAIGRQAMAQTWPLSLDQPDKYQYSATRMTALGTGVLKRDSRASSDSVAIGAFSLTVARNVAATVVIGPQTTGGSSEDSDGGRLFDSVQSTVVGSYNLMTEKTVAASTTIGNPLYTGFSYNTVIGTGNFKNMCNNTTSGHEENVALGRGNIGTFALTDADNMSGVVSGPPKAFEKNIAIGTENLYNVPGDYNIGMGYQTMYKYVNATNNSVGTSDKNIAIGYKTMSGTPWGGTSNIAIGSESFTFSLKEPNTNIAVGYRTMYSGGTNPIANVAVGYQALFSGDTSDKAIALGYEALKQGNNSDRTVALGMSAGWGVSGDTSSIFIGSYAGQHAGGRGYTFANGTNNTNGFGTLPQFPTEYDIFMGWEAGARWRGQNRGKGYNIALGYQSLYSGETQQDSINIGRLAGRESKVLGGYGNIRIGTSAGYSGSGFHSQNVILGDQAGYRGGSDGSVAIGQAALTLATGSTGSYAGNINEDNRQHQLGNVGIGYKSAMYMLSGTSNIFIGNKPGVGVEGTSAHSFKDGSYNIYIGRNTKPGTGPAGTIGHGLHREIVIGNFIQGKGVNTTFIGGASVYNESDTSTWNTTSDERLKKNIVNSPKGLEEIYKLQIRNFEWREDHEIEEGLRKNLKTGVLKTGVIAQEVLEIFPEAVTEESSGTLSVNTDPIVFASIKAIQELKDEIESLKLEIKELKKNK